VGEPMIEKRRDHHQSFFWGWFSTISDFQANFFCGHYPLNVSKKPDVSK
jgi:hypothetical protein